MSLCTKYLTMATADIDASIHSCLPAETAGIFALHGNLPRLQLSFARRGLALSGLIWLAGAVSCSSSTSPAAATIKVAINAPSGVTVTATLKGPQGFTRTLTQTLAYTQLVPGTYTVTAVVSPPAQSVRSSVPSSFLPFREAPRRSSPGARRLSRSTWASVPAVARSGSSGPAMAAVALGEWRPVLLLHPAQAVHIHAFRATQLSRDDGRGDRPERCGRRQEWKSLGRQRYLEQCRRVHSRIQWRRAARRHRP